MIQSRKVTIIGAGLVGSLLSILLKKRGCEVLLIEKRGDPRQTGADQGRSINLIVTSRGLVALSLAGLEQQVKDLSVKVFGREIHDTQSKTVYQPYGKKDECNFAISRSRLNHFLMTEAEKAGVKILFDQRIQTIDFAKKKIIREDVAGDREELAYDLLFGTDGVGSIVRSQLVSMSEVDYRVETEWLGISYKELIIPVGAQGQAQLKPEALHIWPRGKFMMMALANFDQSFTVTLYMKEKSQTEGEMSFAQLGTESEILSFFRKQFPDALELLNGSDSALARDFKTHPHSPLGTVRLNRWIYEDSVVLMGDAAHGVVPFFGQGMNSGFEDCSALMRLLDQGHDWGATLQMLYHDRKPNADAIADMAVENWYEMSELVADPKFLLRKKVEAILEEKMPKEFKSRYGMVTYTEIPYSVVQKLGEKQNQIFAESLRSVADISEVDFCKLEEIILSQYKPLVERLSNI